MDLHLLAARKIDCQRAHAYMHDCAATAALVSIAHCVIALDTARVHDAVVMRTCLLTSLVHSPVAMRM